MGKYFTTSEDTCAWVREREPRVMLAFSTGKDSIASWLQLRTFWDKPGEIVPVFQGGITSPDGKRQLGFIERSLAYYEDFFGTRIYRITHPTQWRRLAETIYQPSHRHETIRLMQEYNVIPYFDGVEDANERVRKCDDVGRLWVATGLRITDSLTRRATIKRNGSAYPDKLLFYPIWDWTMPQLLEALDDAGVGLPLDYLWFGRSYEGFDYQTVSALREFAPDDYALLKTWYPLLDANLFRLEQRERLIAQRTAQIGSLP